MEWWTVSLIYHEDLIISYHGGVYNVVVQSWNVFVDGTSNAWGVGIGIVIMSQEGIKLELSLRLGFRASNN